MDNAKNLSFTNIFNQRKVIINGSQTVSVPVNINASTVVSVPTNQLQPVTYIAFVTLGGELYSVNARDYLINNFNIDISVGIDLTMNFFIKVLNFSGSPVSALFDYRVYIDSRPGTP